MAHLPAREPDHSPPPAAGASDTPADIVVVSDLHMGRGKNEATGRFHRLEAFFYDPDLLSFCRWLCAEAAREERQVKLVFNGDTFDFLRIEPERPEPGASLIERHYGPLMGPDAATRVAGRILSGHPAFGLAVATVLAAGHEVIFLPGNHDIEVQFEPVRAVVKGAVRCALVEMGCGQVDDAMARLRFEAWFYYEPGRVWIEHGCQYDPENAFRYPLRAGLVERPEARDELERDMPLGNFFQRYLYNHFGSVTFIVPSTRANLRYMKFLLFNQPAVVTRVALSHLPFTLQVLRRLASSAGSRRTLAEAHEVELDKLSASSGLGETLRAIDGLKDVGADVTRAAETITRQLVKVVAAVLLAGFCTTGLWLFSLLSLSQMEADAALGTAVLKTLMLLTLTFILIAASVGTAGWLLLRAINAPYTRPLRGAAQRLATALDVSVVCFGHTHDEVLYPLRRPGGGRAWYYNTGTWISVFTHDVLLPRERTQFSFLRLRGDTPELLHWSPARGGVLPVILIDEEDEA